MKIYRVEWLMWKEGHWEPHTITTTKLEHVAAYVLDQSENPEQYKEFKLYVGELKEVEVDTGMVSTLAKLF